jgi:dipeptidyl aminopeptidase/acylaminoacyl peptidase
MIFAVLVGLAFCMPDGLIHESGAAFAGEKSEKPEAEKVAVESWLLLGPVSSPLPAYADDESKKGAKELLSYEHFDLAGATPVKGDRMSVIGGREVVWKLVSADTSGADLAVEGETPQIAYLATYIDVPRWMKVNLEARGTNAYELTINGSSVIKQTGAAKMKDDPKKGDAKLEKGKHLVLVKTVFTPPEEEEEGEESDDDVDSEEDEAEEDEGWRFDLKVSACEDFDETPVVSLSPARGMNVGDVLNAMTVSRVDLSPDGLFYAVWLSERKPPDGDSEGRMEVRRLRDDKLIRTFRDMGRTGSWSWAPEGLRLSYVATGDDGSSLRVIDLETGEIETLLEDVEDFGGYRWSPEGSYIAYSVDVDYEPDDSGIKRLLGAYDRRHYERDRSFLYLSSVPGGMTREMTTGEYSTEIYDIHPDADRMLIGRYYEDLSRRPYAITELSILNVKDQTTEELLKGPWIRGGVWSPDGDKILVFGGPSAFGDIGVNIPAGVIPNEYDTQAYIYDPKTKDVEPITKDFDPTIEWGYWPKPGGDIYFAVEETEYREIYRYNIRRGTFKKIDLPCDVIHSADVARDRAVAMCRGSSANEPLRLYAVDLVSGKVRTVIDPAKDHFEHVKIGEVEDFDFVASNGKTIVGRVHFPPDFDPGVTYPCIVYYYGGTSPVGRSFGGRYPKNLWASMGYVVYVLQPSGATGFGQEFSAAHVNDWGKTTTKEIIEGVGAFLEAHPYVDPDRIGCIGASYGGFMTQLIVTKTDIFAAAVSHAGISALTSYWGEGYWGYLYSAAATANSFPWNRPDIYVQHSPIYAADKINTPLLLLHGASDTNVPPGESEQMYTALKLLGKEVEYIRVIGENHWIINYKKRIAWSNAIVSWFDKWLKDEHEWWDDMYPPVDKDDEPGEEESESKKAKASPKKAKAKPAKAAPAGDGAEAEELKIKLPMPMEPVVVELEKYGTVLLGEVTREDIAKHLPDWNAEYFEYAPDGRLKADLARYLKDVEITCVIGTWCPDCRREIPRLWRVLEEVGYPVSRMKLYAVGSTRWTSDMPIPKDALNWSGITRKFFGAEAVATIIFKRNGVELGRIVESPEITLEEDILKIVKK